MRSFKVSTETSSNYWFELNYAQEQVAKLLREYLHNAFYLKYAYDAEAMKSIIFTAADKMLESSSTLSTAYRLIEHESCGLSVHIRVDFVGNDLIGVIVDDIKVTIE
jgi:hypothetical protein